MGAEAVSITLRSDGDMVEKKYSKSELKRSRECVLDATEGESPNKKPAIECSNDENLKCVVDAIEVDYSIKESSDVENRVVNASEVENPDEKPVKESPKDEDSSRVESKCLHEFGLNATEAERPLDKSRIESSDDENSSKLESKCLNEFVVDAMQVENPNEKSVKESSNDENIPRLQLKRSHECGVDDTETESPNKKPAIEILNKECSSTLESKCLDECVVDAIEVENPKDKPAKESSDDESYSRVEIKCPHECSVYTTEADSPNMKSAIESVNDHNSPRVESKCSDEYIADATEVVNDESYSGVESKCSEECVVEAIDVENSNKKPAKESSDDESSSRLELKDSHECGVDATEAESMNKKPAIEFLNDKKYSKVEFKCSDECVVDPIKVEKDESSSREESKCSDECLVEAIEVDTTNKTPTKESSNDENSSRVEPKGSHERGVDATEAESPKKKPALESSNDENSSGGESKCLDECPVDDIEVDTPNNKPGKEFSKNGNPLRVESKCLNECVVDAIEVETPDKRLAKDYLTESSSEILNLNVSPQENASSSQTVSSQPVEGLSGSICGDISSSSAGDSSANIADNGGHCINLSSSVFKSEVILEGPKVANTSGVKRIIFKFSKSRSTNDDVSSPTVHPSYPEVENGFSYSRLHKEPNMNYLEMKKFKKCVLENYTKNVKKWLSTGVLEGVEVKYINQEKEFLRGIIKDCGYLCGCDLCNFSRVLSASEFEQHAGCKTKHPNDHVFLNNGKSLHSIVQELKATPASSLEGIIRALVGPLFNEKSYLAWKESLESENFLKSEKKGEINKQSHLNLGHFPQSVASCSSEDTEDSLGSASRYMMQKFPDKHKVSMVQSISKRSKWVSKKLSTSPSSIGRSKKRDNDLHRALFMPNGLPDGAELAYYAKGQRVLDGYKQGNGIVCSCCDSEISPSQFEAHAGCAAKRQPYRHIYTSDGVSLHDIALSLANSQSCAISTSGDMCTICGDGGDLIVCDACSHAFHAACLQLLRIPEGEWRCPYCKDKIGFAEKLASSEAPGSVRPLTIRLTRVVKAPATEIGGCVVCRAPDFTVLKFDDRTVIICDQCEKEYHVGCLRKRGLCDLKELPTGKWFCCEHCSRIQATLENLILTGAKKIPDSMLNPINKKLAEKGLTSEVGDNVQWQLLSGKFGPHKIMLNRAVTIFRGSFDPIVETSGLDLIPAMVLAENVAGQEFGGMYCAVLSVKSVVVSAGLLRIFGQEVAELPLVATTKESQGKGYFQTLFSIIERLLCFLNVEKLVLPAAENAASIWTSKFGFKKMSEDQFQKYTKDIQLISFKGTLMLEKAVSRSQQHCAES